MIIGELAESMRAAPCRRFDRIGDIEGQPEGGRKMAAWDNRYMEQVLIGTFHA